MGVPGLGKVGVDSGRLRFPDGAVLARTVSLDLVEGDPQSRRRVETQILHREAGSWRPYSYRWDDTQSDATLVDSAGANRSFAVRDRSEPGGTRQHDYRFAGRSECVLCHNPWVESNNVVYGRQSASPLAMTVEQLDRGKQLHDFETGGLVDAVPTGNPPRLADPRDRSAPLELPRAFLPPGQLRPLPPDGRGRLGQHRPRGPDSARGDPHARRRPPAGHLRPDRRPDHRPGRARAVGPLLPDRQDRRRANAAGRLQSSGRRRNAADRRLDRLDPPWCVRADPGRGARPGRTRRVAESAPGRDRPPGPHDGRHAGPGPGDRRQDRARGRRSRGRRARTLVLLARGRRPARPFSARVRAIPPARNRDRPGHDSRDLRRRGPGPCSVPCWRCGRVPLVPSRRGRRCRGRPAPRWCGREIFAGRVARACPRPVADGRPEIRDADHRDTRRPGRLRDRRRGFASAR